MTARELTLNIAVNLGRVSRWAAEGKEKRIRRFLSETEDYLVQLESAPKNPQFQKTFDTFKKRFAKLQENVRLDEVWAEEALTWANILSHRARLA